MRRLLYAVAAVVALAPLAAIVPASAAVQHPAAPQTACDGHEVATIEDHPSAGATNDSYWFVGPNAVNDAHANQTDWCVLPDGKVSNNNVFSFRQEGTSNCAAAGGAGGTQVVIVGCDPSLLGQEWQITHPGPQTGQIWSLAPARAGQFVTGEGGDTPLFFAANDGPLGDQVWTINCIANACSL